MIINGAFSSPTDRLIREDIAHLEQSFEDGSALGVPARVLCGVEIDFALMAKTHERYAGIEASKEEITKELATLRPQTDAQTALKAEWLAQVPHLTMSEIINYYLYRELATPSLGLPSYHEYPASSPSATESLEFRFGQGVQQTGYYDVPGQFEMRTQAAKPTVALERFTRAVETADALAERYDTSFSYQYGHTNLSVWTEQDGQWRPMHTLQTKAGKETARRGAAGILLAVRDSHSLLNPTPVAVMPMKHAAKLTALPERGGHIRVLPDRYEIRTRIPYASQALGMLALMSGFAHGVTGKKSQMRHASLEEQTHFMADESFDKSTSVLLLRAIQKSTVGADGHLIPQDYFTYEQAERTLQHMLGYDVYFSGDTGKHFTRRVLSAITLSETGQLDISADALRNAFEQSWGIRFVDTADPEKMITQLKEKLRHIHRVSITAVKGSLYRHHPSGITYHADIEAARTAPSLGFISAKARDAVAQERGARFTREDAVTELCLRTLSAANGKLRRADRVVAGICKENYDADRHVVVSKLIARLTTEVEKSTRQLKGAEDNIAAALAAGEHPSLDDEYDASTYPGRIEMFNAHIKTLS